MTAKLPTPPAGPGPASRSGLAAVLVAFCTFFVAAAEAAKTPSRPSAGETRGGEFRRFALVVGADDGGPERVKLRYATSDADAFAGVITELGGVAGSDLLLLRNPTRKALLGALEEIRGRIAAAGGRSGRLELLVYYSGHSDESGLLLGGEKLRYTEFRARIDSVQSKIRLAIVDACASGALIRLKGGRRLPAFTVDRSSSLQGYAFLTSSSGHESAQESDRIRASFFTHYLVTGLRGGADLNQDGRVTLAEAYEFAFHETLSQTEGSQAGAQHPSYDMRLTGSGDLVLTDLRGTSAGLVLDPSLRGRLFVRGPSGALVAELQKQPGRKVELGLEPGLYDLRLDRGDSLFRTLVRVDALTHNPVTPASFESEAREATRERGGLSDSAAMAASGAAIPSGSPAAAGGPAATGASFAAVASPWIPTRAAFIPALGFPGQGAGPYSHNLSLNLLVGHAQDIHGFQFSLLLNRVDGELHGMQLSAAANRSGGAARGMQLTGLVNYAESLRGLQAGILSNTAARLDGFQAGMVNAAGRARGLQVGAVNAAWRGTGVQAGLVNVAGRFTGVQAGLLNIAKKADGAVLGPLNIIGNGLHDLEVSLDEKSMLRTAVQLGGRHNYTWYSFDMKGRYPRHLWGGSGGLGLHIPSGPVYAAFDAGAGILYNEEDWDNYSVTGRMRWMIGYAPMRYFAVFGGFSYNLEAWPASRYPNLNPGSDGQEWGSDIRSKRWPGFFFGVRI